MITLYGIANCDTIKKTKVWLNKNEVEFEFHDYKKLGCSTELAEVFFKHFSQEQIINTRGTTWRKLDPSEKENLDPAKAKRLICANPSMIKRPILGSESAWVIGFSEANLQKLLT